MDDKTLEELEPEEFGDFIKENGVRLGWKELPSVHPDQLITLAKNEVKFAYFRSGTATLQGKGIQQSAKYANAEEVLAMLAQATKVQRPTTIGPQRVVVGPRAGLERGGFAHSFMKVLMQDPNFQDTPYYELADEAVKAADALIERLAEK